MLKEHSKLICPNNFYHRYLKSYIFVLITEDSLVFMIN